MGGTSPWQGVGGALEHRHPRFVELTDLAAGKK